METGTTLEAEIVFRGAAEHGDDLGDVVMPSGTQAQHSGFRLYLLPDEPSPYSGSADDPPDGNSVFVGRRRAFCEHSDHDSSGEDEFATGLGWVYFEDGSSWECVPVCDRHCARREV